MWLESLNNLGWKGSLEVTWFHSLFKVGLASVRAAYSQLSQLNSEQFQILQLFGEIFTVLSSPPMKDVFLMANGIIPCCHLWPLPLLLFLASLRRVRFCLLYNHLKNCWSQQVNLLSAIFPSSWIHTHLSASDHILCAPALLSWWPFSGLAQIYRSVYCTGEPESDLLRNNLQHLNHNRIILFIILLSIF